MVILNIKSARGTVCICIEPILQTFFVKYVLTWNLENHLASLDLVKANGTLLCLLKFYCFQKGIYMSL